MIPGLLAAIAVFSYLLGGLNGAIIASKYVFHRDVRDYGSGNAGLTNFFRTFGAPGLAIVIGTDVLKTVIAVVAGGLIMGTQGAASTGQVFAGFCVMLGHIYPVFYGFRGGKGILSSAALAIMMDWRIFVIGFSLFLIIVFATHYVSLGSILAATAYAVLFVIFFPGQPWIWSIAIAMAVLAIFMHRSNIARLIHGTETKTYLLKSKKK